MTTAVSAARVRAHPWARPQAAPARREGWRSVVGTLHEPNAWTVGVVLASGIVLIARHPIARAIGTEATARPSVTTAAPALSHLAPVPSLTLPLAAAPTHAPRDPFRALVTAAGKVLGPVEAPGRTPAVSAAAASAACTGTSHRVVAGDTLWGLAARAVRSRDTDRVTIAWHRLYAANRAAVGADPSVLAVGRSLCVPTSL